MKELILFSAALLFAALPSFAEEESVDLCGAGDYVFSVPHDLSYVGRTVAVDETASTTNYPDVAYPALQEFIVWRNIKLTDVKTFTAKLGGKMHWEWYERGWSDATTYHVKTNEGGSVECQFQVQRNSYIYSVRVLFTQRGDDVAARIGFGNTQMRYAYKNDVKKLGYDFTQTSDGATSLGKNYLTCAENSACIKDIACVLNDGVSIKEAPARLVFQNTDETVYGESQYETNRYSEIVWPQGKDIVAFRSVALEDVVAIEGEMGGSKMWNAWRSAGSYFMKVDRDGYDDAVMNTNAGSRVRLQMQCLGEGSGLYCCNIQLRQIGADIAVRMAGTEWAYGKALGSHDFDTAGSLVAFTNTVDGSGLSLRDLKLISKKKTVRNVTVKTSSDCLGYAWTKIWPNARLEDVRPASALMGGASVGSRWRNVLAWLPTKYNGHTNWYFQTPYSSSTRSIRVAFAQEGNDVYAGVRYVTYGYLKGLPWAAGNNTYQSALTDTVDGNSAVNTLSIRDFTCMRTARPVHTVEMDAAFAPGAIPIHLRDVALQIAPSAGETYTFTSPVTGYGAIGAGGAGNFVLASALPDGVALNVATGGSLLCDLSSGNVPLVNNGATLTAEPGAKISFVSSTAVKNWLAEQIPYQLTSGAGLSDADAAKFTAVLDGKGLGAFKAAFSVADGELFVTFEKKNGFCLIVR